MAGRDTIAAIATPAGAGGVGIVRVSGPDAVAVAGRLLGRAGDRLPDRRMVHGVALDEDGSPIDEVLAVVMRGPRSFTGEDVAELHGHGGVINMARLLRAVLAAGARAAEPGEFTRRAFENGRLDLVRAEALIDVIQASSERAWRLAQAQLRGSLGDLIRSLRERATELLAEIEACIDFPEEGEEYLSHADVAERADELRRDIARLSSTFTLGKALRQGIEVAIVGAVNVGKSSIFNRLAGRERAIVDATPGTTRDFVEASVVWEGIPVTLIDTAGDRDADSDVERRGIAMGRQRAAEADLRVVVHSADAPIPDRVPAAPGELHILSKSDLLAAPPTALLVTSARSGQGVAELKRAIVRVACGDHVEGDEGHVVTSERHRGLLDAGAAALGRAMDAVRAGRATELVALEVRDATEHLAQILGESVGEEVLDVLFRRFCIGK